MVFGVKLDRFEGNQDLLAESQKNFGDKLDHFGLGQERIERKLDDSISEMRSGFKQVHSKQDEHQEIFNLLSRQAKIKSRY